MLLSRHDLIVKFLLASLAILICGLLLTGCMGGRFTPTGWAGPTVSNGTLYVASFKDGDLLSVNLSDRSVTDLTPRAGEKPSSFLGCQGSEPPVLVPYGTPLVWSGTMVYVASYEGKIYAMTPSGAEKWRYDTKSRIVGSPAIDTTDGNPLIVAAGHKLYAFDTEISGTLAWVKPFKAKGEIWSTPVISNGRIYFGDKEHKLYAVDLETGELVWEKGFDGPVLSTPLIVDGTLYIGTFESKFYALNAETGKEVWAKPFEADDWFWTTPAYSQGTVFVGSMDHIVYALDATTGQSKWQYQTQGPIRAAARVAEGILIIASKDGFVYGLDPETGKEKWAPKNLDKKIMADPWIDGDTTYVLNQDDMLFALDAQTGQELWSKSLEL